MSSVLMAAMVLSGKGSGAPTNIIYEGYLSRLGIFKDWNSRYVELSDDCICHYTSKGEVLVF
jgi:hypothetical protein